MQGTVNRINSNGKAFNAEISGTWYGCGFNAPKFKEGDVLEFEVEQRGNFKNLGKHSVIGTSSGSSSAPAPAKASFDDRNVSIAYQSSRKDALVFVQLLVQTGAISLPAKKADQADALQALVEDYAAQFYLKLEEIVKAGGATLEDLLPSE